MYATILTSQHLFGTAGIVIVAIMASIESNRVGLCAMLAIITVNLLVGVPRPVLQLLSPEYSTIAIHISLITHGHLMSLNLHEGSSMMPAG